MPKNTFVFHYDTDDSGVDEDCSTVTLEIYEDNLDEAAREAAETVAEEDWNYEPWDSRSAKCAKDIQILHAPTGRKWRFEVEVQFDPIFHAAPYRPCDKCDENGRSKDYPQHWCHWCSGKKVRT